MDKDKILSILKFIIGWPISLIALFFIFKIISPNFNLLIPYFTKINIPLLILGVLSFLVYFIFRAILWQNILKNKNYDFSLKETIFLWEASEFKRYIPGNIWAFLGRAVSFGEKGVPKKTIAVSLLIEAELLIISSLLLSFLSLSFIFDLFPQIPQKQLLEFIFIFFVLMLSFLFIFSSFLKSRLKNSWLKFILSPFPNFSPGTNFNLILIALVSFFFFGLGTYLSGSAVFILDLSKFLVLIGFFVFALLVGYLSLVTPMGLGVREAVTIFGLVKFMSLELAGFVSIFTRIVFILSELIFLCFAFVWSKSKNIYLTRLEIMLKSNKHLAILIVLTLIYVAYFTLASFLRYDNFYAGRFDLGNMDQVVWNTINGRIFLLTDPNGTKIISRLAFHADFILVFLSPLYLIWSSAKMLLLVQSIVLGIGGLFVYLMSRQILKNKNISLVFAFLYFISPAVNYTNLYDFHAVTLATTFLLAAVYYLIINKRLLFGLFVLLAALTKEQLWLTAGLLFIYFAISEFVCKKTKKKIFYSALGILASVICFFIFYSILWILIPNARGEEHFALSYYSDFGQTPSEIVKNLILSPGKIISIALHPDSLLYLEQLLLPLGLISLLSPFYIIFAMPDLLVNLLSSNTQLHQIYYQYSAAITPFIFISAIYAAKKLNAKFKILRFNYLVIYLLISGLYFAYLYGPLPGAKNANLAMFLRPLKNRELVSEFVSKIPKKYSIAASNNLGAHLSHRQLIYTIPNGVNEADIVAFLLNDSYTQPSLKAQKQMAEDLEKDTNYEVLIKDMDFIVFRKR